MKKETQTIEFKQSWHDEYLEWICGYANAYGGALYIGRADNGTPVGVAKAKSLMESIPCKITDKITVGCKEYGGPRPSYKIGESGVMVLCKACPAYLELKNAGIEQQPRTTQTTTQSTTQTTAQKILAIIKANPNVSRSALSREIGLSSDGIKWHLQKLKEGNAIRRVGPKYGGHWEVVE